MKVSGFPEERKNSHSGKGKKTRNPGYEPGNHWVECEVCGFVIRSKEAKVRWDGVIVCPSDWEMRHPQDFVRAKEDKISPDGIVRPESEDSFVDVTYSQTSESPNLTPTNDNSL